VGKEKLYYGRWLYKMALLICDGIVDFAPTFVGVKL
jgi:hypothetical protein